MDPTAKFVSQQASSLVSLEYVQGWCGLPVTMDSWFRSSHRFFPFHTLTRRHVHTTACPVSRAILERKPTLSEETLQEGFARASSVQPLSPFRVCRAKSRREARKRSEPVTPTCSKSERRASQCPSLRYLAAPQIPQNVGFPKFFSTAARRESSGALCVLSCDVVSGVASKTERR